MKISDFQAFYAAAHNGREPFPWQARLADEVITHGWPDTIAVPTGCGKTSVIDVAVFALAFQADLPAVRRSPIRMFFVVDRRLVVDDVSRHAEHVAEVLREANNGIAAEIAHRLRSFGGEEALITATLRGGMYRSDAWADAPNQPVVCVSTVDQVGSRLLFRGYGLSDARRPIDAALVGADSLIVLDEAHLSQPFLDTLKAVQQYQGEKWAERPVAAPLRVVQMSATSRETGAAFGLEERDYASVLRRRLNAVKTAVLEETAALERTAVERARGLADAGAGVTGIVLNTVSSARQTFELLKDEGEECVLLIGRVRPFDRDQVMERYLERIKTDRQQRNGERLFVVATQTVEVGADLDFDSLVTELAPVDSLRQRFGRLDRVGRIGRSQAFVLKPKKAKERDWIYGEASARTWAWLNERATKQKTGSMIDFGVRAMQSLYESEGDDSLLTKSERGPLLFPAHLDQWVQTNPSPALDPDVAPFLHGADALRAADVQVVWRSDLPEAASGAWAEAWIETVALAPPLVTEALPVPIGAARIWLRREIADIADQEGAAVEPEPRNGETPARRFVIWRGPDRSIEGDLRNVKPGDTIVLRSDEGGTDEFGWNPSSGLVRDIGDPCANERAKQGLGRFRVRIHPDVLYSPDEKELRESLKDILTRAAADDSDAWDELARLRDSQAGPRTWAREPQAYSGGVIWNSRWPKREVRRIKAEFDEEDETDASSLTREVTLENHTEGVVRVAREFALCCRVSDSVRAAVERATMLHDAGKADHRFQLLLAVDRAPDQEPLAKSAPSSSPAEIRRRRERSGYPAGARHEFSSVALAEASRSWPADCDGDLVLHLIGTHHGFGRPSLPLWEDDPSIVVGAQIEDSWTEISVASVIEMQTIGSEWVDRFWSLIRRYGWWGLAYLEAIVRRADCVRSRQEQEDTDA